MTGLAAQLLFCLIFGYAGTFLGSFMFTLTDMMIKTMTGHHLYVYFMMVLSVTLFFSWVLGAATSWMDAINHFFRGILVTIFFNGSIVLSYRSKFEIDFVDLADWTQLPIPLVVIMVLNALIAIYGSKSIQTFSKIPEEKTDDKSLSLAFAVGMPMVMIGGLWILVLTYIFLDNRFNISKWLGHF